MDNTEKPSILSLCSGYGGMEIGLERALGEISVCSYVEIEAFAIANLVDKIEQGQMVPAPIWTDLKTFPGERFRGCVDILTGGYPCQPFSHPGKRLGTEDPRHLWSSIKNVIKETDPILCFFENVTGHISLGLREVLTDLEGLGYKVETSSGEPTWGIFSAAEVGASQNRERIYILAYTDDERLPRWQIQSMSKCSEQRLIREGCSRIWPARPGLKQHDWEEPRKTDDQLNVNWSEQLMGLDSTWTRLSTAGYKDHRTDRTRLIGNGVVPLTAEKAFTTLFSRISN